MPRRSLILFLLLNLLFLAFLVSSVWTLLTLLFTSGASDAISRAELPGPNSSLNPDAHPRLIPKIIHQTYINESIPAHWVEAQQSCIDLHEDYEYILWTDRKSREFIAEEYPWFLETFDGYPYPIMRADAIRYFVLVHFGGVYIDLDDGCQRRLDPLLTYSAWVRRTLPTGISNDVMGSVPHHPFFLKVIDALPRYDRSWLLPYITVMGSTGPLFLSVIWRHYTNELSDPPLEEERLRILFPDEYNKNSWSFFSHHVGSSWHRADVKLIMWMRDHWGLLVVVGTIVGLTVIYGMYAVYQRVVNKSSVRGVRISGTMLRRLLRRRTGSGTVKLGEQGMPLLDRRNSDLEARRAE